MILLISLEQLLISPIAWVICCIFSLLTFIFTLTLSAARAGAAGKGFAVVADEVRNLANKSTEASENIAALIENSLQAIENGLSWFPEL